jgi:sarcosine oxidase subunit alpha
MEIETQNVLGSADHDLLAAADWVFPGGMNHHKMFTWSKTANRAMQTVARRIAGIGKLPNEPRRPLEIETRSCDVLVVGGGPTGLAAAASAAQAGLDVVLVDEEERLGGHLVYTSVPVKLRESDASIEAPSAALSLIEDASARGATLLTRASVLGIFSERGDAGDARFIALIDRDEGAMTIRGRSLILAQGRHEGASAFAGNDLPGVIGSEAAFRLLEHGVLCGERVVLAIEKDTRAEETARIEALSSALRNAGAEVLGPFELSSIAEARGRTGVSSVDVRIEKEVQRFGCDALVIAPSTSAVYELAEQAGALIVWRKDAFEIVASKTNGETRVPWVRVVGRASGVYSVPEGIAQARGAAASQSEELRA